MNASARALLIALLSAPAAAAVQAQAPAVEEGILVFRRDGRDVGGESFRVDPNASGYRITAHAVFSGQRPPIDFTATLDRGPGTDLAFQLSRRAGDVGRQTYLVQKRNRVTVRQVGRGGERASELPGGPGVVVLSDSVFSLYLQIPPLATEAGVPLTAIYPQDARRVGFTARRIAGEGPTALVRLAGGIDGEIELGDAGEVLRISIPAIGLEALRKLQ